MTVMKRYALLLMGALFVLGPLSAQAQFNTNWEFSAAQGNNPSYIGSDDAARNLAYGTVDDGTGTMVERVFVSIADSPYQIKILKASDGTDTGNTLPGVSSLPETSNGRKVNDVNVTPGGIIIACNEPNNPFIGGSTQSFKCWRWDSLTDSPTQVVDYTPPDNSGDGLGDWIGRQFSMVGTASDNSLTFMTSAASGNGQTSTYVYRFTTSDNAQSFTAEAIERTGRPPSGNIVGVTPAGSGASSFIFNEGTTQPIAYASDGSEQVQEPGFFSNYTWTPKYFEADGQELLAVFNWEGSGGHNAELANINNGLDVPNYYGQTSSLGGNSNANGTGDLAIRDNGDGSVTIYVLATNNGIGSYTTTSALPVEMASFQATTTSSDAVQLTWTTASETNNAGFRVQRQTEDGSWTQLGFVDSKADGGSTTATQQYRFAVENGLAPGTHRFRLEQVDLDGTTHLSDVVSAEVQMQSALELTAPSPNPVTGSATLSFAVKNTTDATLTLYNVLGQQVRTLYTGTPTAGEAQTVRLSTDGLTSGTYLLRLQANGATKTTKVTVLR